MFELISFTRNAIVFHSEAPIGGKVLDVKAIMNCVVLVGLCCPFLLVLPFSIFYSFFALFPPTKLFFVLFSTLVDRERSRLQRIYIRGEIVKPSGLKMGSERTLTTIFLIGRITNVIFEYHMKLTSPSRLSTSSSSWSLTS